MMKLPRRRVFVAAIGAVAAVAAAGYSAQDITASSPAAARSASLPATRATLASAVTGTSTPSPRVSSAGSVCVTSAQMGHCPFGPYRGITGAGENPYVDQNVWGPIPGWQQTLHANNPGHWHVVANMPAGNTAVVSFPNTGFAYNKPLSRYSSIVSSFSDQIPQRAGTNAEASYDIWFNNTSKIDEVMIQNDFSPGRGPGCGTWTAQRVRFGGSNGIPSHRWDLCVGQSTAWWETASGNMPTGKVDVLAMLKYLVRHGLGVPRRAELTGFSYGFEISSTGGVNETFRVNSFSAAARR